MIEIMKEIMYILLFSFFKLTDKIRDILLNLKLEKIEKIKKILLFIFIILGRVLKLEIDNIFNNYESIY